jgi:hypothetical protein
MWLPIGNAFPLNATASIEDAVVRGAQVMPGDALSNRPEVHPGTSLAAG